jgi:hypothetical protein
MITKWDIVEDVASARAVDSTKHMKRGKIKGTLRAAVATTLFAGTLLLPQYAVSNPVTLSPKDFAISDGQQTGFIKVKSEFVRPRGDRKAEASLATDTNIGMSTRRLGETYAKLVRPIEDEDTELTEEYNFL